jgi:hypothetical protein
MTTLLTDYGVTEAPAGTGAGDELWLDRDTAARATGWALKPEGLCKDDICVPVPAGEARHFVRGSEVNLAAFWRHMGKPAAHDAGGTVWALGEAAADRSLRLASLEAPDFELPDLEGRTHRLSDQRGKRVFLVSWASW